MMINSENAEVSLFYPLESLQDLNSSSYIPNCSTNSKINLNYTISFVKEYCKNILENLIATPAPQQLWIEGVSVYSTSNPAQILMLRKR